MYFILFHIFFISNSVKWLGSYAADAVEASGINFLPNQLLYSAAISQSKNQLRDAKIDFEIWL